MAKPFRQVRNSTLKLFKQATCDNGDARTYQQVRLKRNVCMFILALPLLVGASVLPVNYSMAQTSGVKKSNVTIKLTGSEVNETKGWVRLDVNSSSHGSGTDYGVNFTVSVASGSVSDVIEAVYIENSIDANGDLTGMADTEALVNDKIVGPNSPTSFPNADEEIYLKLKSGGSGLVTVTLENGADDPYSNDPDVVTYLRDSMLNQVVFQIGQALPEVKITTTTHTVEEGDSISYTVSTDSDLSSLTNPLSVTVTGSGDYFLSTGSSTTFMLSSANKSQMGTAMTSEKTTADGDDTLTVAIDSSPSTYVIVANHSEILVNVIDKNTARPQLTITTTTPEIAENQLAPSFVYTVTSNVEIPDDGTTLNTSITVNLTHRVLGVYFFANSGAINLPPPSQITIAEGNTSETFTFIAQTTPDNVDGYQRTLEIEILDDTNTIKRYTVNRTNDMHIAETTITDSAAISGDNTGLLYSRPVDHVLREGEPVVFTVYTQSTRTASGPLTVNLSITGATQYFDFNDTSNFPNGTFPTSIEIKQNATEARLILPTVNNEDREPDGILTVAVTTGSPAYELTTNRYRKKFSITIRSDNPNPMGVSVFDQNPSVSESQKATFLITTSAAGGFTDGLMIDLTITCTDSTTNLSIACTGLFVSTPDDPIHITGAKVGESEINYEVDTNNTIENPNFTVTVRIEDGTDYDPSTSNNTETVSVSDDDSTPALKLEAYKPGPNRIMNNGTVSEGEDVGIRITTSTTGTNATTASYENITVRYRITESSTNKGDFLSAEAEGEKTATILARENTARAVIDDLANPVLEIDDDEHDDGVSGTFTIELLASQDNKYTLSTESADDTSLTITVNDNDAVAVVELTSDLGPSETSVTEGTNVTFTFGIPQTNETKGADFAISVRYEFTLGAASADFVRNPTTGTQTLEIAKGSTSVPHTIETIQDSDNEANSSFTMTLLDDDPVGSNYTKSATANAISVGLEDNDTPQVTISTANPNVVETATAGMFSIEFDIIATPAPYQDLSISLAITDASSIITGTPPTSVLMDIDDPDGLGASDTVGTVCSMTTNSCVTTVQVPLTDDTIVNTGIRSILVELGTTSITGYAVSPSGPDDVTFTIEDNEALWDGPRVSVTAVNATVQEGPSNTAIFRLEATPPPAANTSLTVKISVTASDQSIIPNVPQTAMITDSTTGIVDVPIMLQDDNEDKPDIVITLMVLPENTPFSSGDTYRPNTDPTKFSTAKITVQDNDTPVVTVTAGESVNEGTALRFTLSASPKPHVNITVSYTVSENGEMVISTEEGKNQLTISAANCAPASCTEMITVQTEGDSVDEMHSEVTLTVNATNSATYTPGPPISAMVFDDDVPMISMENATNQPVVEGEDLVVTFKSDIAPYKDLAVALCITDGSNHSALSDCQSAANGSAGNFLRQPVAASVPMPQGQVSVTGVDFAIPTWNDDNIEDDGTVSVSIVYTDLLQPKFNTWRS